MEYERRQSGLIVPRHRGEPCSVLMVNHLIGFGALAAAAAGPVQPVFDSATKDPDVTLSGSDRTASMGAATGGAVTTAYIALGTKRYVEILCPSVGGDNWRCGIATSGYVTTTAPGNAATEWVYTGNGNKRTNNANTAYGSALSNGNILMAAIDLQTAMAVWWGINGTWQASGDPAAGTGAAFTSLADAVAITFGRAGGSGTWSATLTLLASYTYSPPTGFLAGI